MLKSQWILTGVLKGLENAHSQTTKQAGEITATSLSRTAGIPETLLWKVQVATILPDPGTWLSPHGPCFFASLAPDPLSGKNHQINKASVIYLLLAAETKNVNFLYS